jgi:hypothetical protein
VYNLPPFRHTRAVAGSAEHDSFTSKGLMTMLTAHNAEASPFASAAAAVALPEVQELIKKLAQYNLGAYALHMHDANGTVQTLPPSTIVVEKDAQISFVDEGSISATQRDGLAPVGWRYSNGELRVFARCNSTGCGD